MEKNLWTAKKNAYFARRSDQSGLSMVLSSVCRRVGRRGSSTHSGHIGSQPSKGGTCRCGRWS